jgi:large subunit ribosomal protein L31
MNRSLPPVHSVRCGATLSGAVPFDHVIPPLREIPMKTDIHPTYLEASVRCSCGNTFTTRSTKPEIHLELCNECHPFFTGKQKLVDSGGRVERFQRRYAKTGSRKKSAAPPTS